MLSALDPSERASAESVWGRLARIIVMRPRLMIAVVLLVTAALATELRHLHLQVTLHDNIQENHPHTRIDERLAAEFGVQQSAIVALGVRDGDIFNPSTLERLQRLTDAVARVPGAVPGSVASITSPSVKTLRADADGLLVGPLVPSIPHDPAGLAALRATVFANPMYIGNLVTADGRGALVVADFAGDDPERVTAALEAVAARERDDRHEIYVGGQPPALAALDGVTRSIAPLLVLALLVIALVHYEAFRTGQAVILPLATAGLSVVWAMGLMGLLGFNLTPWSAVTSILVLSVAAGHAVQILKRYYECFDDLRDNRAAVIASVTRMGPVMVTAGLVAAGGFASLATFGMPAVRGFGLMAALGILSALVVELTIIPACRSLLPAPRSAEAERERRHRLLDPALDAIAGAVCRRPRLVLGVIGVAVLTAALGMLRLEVNTSFRSWFSPDARVIVADRIINRRFTGTSTIRILVDGHVSDALLNPGAMAAIDELEAALAAEPAVTATLAVADYMKMTNRAMLGGDAGAYRMPTSRHLIAQYLGLFSTGDLGRVVSADYRVAAIYALSRSDDARWAEGLFARLRQLAAERFPRGFTVSIAGGELGQMLATNQTVVREKLMNMLQVSVVIFALSSLVFRSVLGGLVVLAPLACAALVNLGLMGWLGIPLSFATATFTAMGVSLGADFAIYLIFRLREEARVRSLADAIHAALCTSGKAIFFVASAIAAGYLTLLVSGFALWRQLGLHVALMMLVSALATLTLLPALILIRPPRFLSRFRKRPAIRPLPPPLPLDAESAPDRAAPRWSAEATTP